MERPHRAPLSSFYAPGAWGQVVELGESAAHHASVKRLAVGDRVRLTDGAGRLANGTLESMNRRLLTVGLDGPVKTVIAPAEITLHVPVGDRERMLWLAEKSVELGLSAWRPVVYRRSLSVSPRGAGAQFAEKVRLRMISALEQSGGAWLPDIGMESTPEQVLGRAGQSRILLDAQGPPIGAVAAECRCPVHLALGPEGGLDDRERAAFIDAGWRAASLGSNVLRFETAAIAALAIIRSHEVA